MQNLNSQSMKASNMRTLLNTVRKEGKISRKRLSEVTGLTIGTVTNLTHDLLEKRYLMESGSGESMGGRKPIFLEINAEAGYVAGMELESSQITCVLSDFRGNPLYKASKPLSARRDRDSIIEQMLSLFMSSIQESQIPYDAILGLGLAIPGPCDYKRGIMLNPPNFPGLRNVPMRQIFTEKLKIPVYTGKDTSCAVLSEYWFGSAGQEKRLFGMTVGRKGIGGALVLNGRIFQESEGESMDIGHTIVHLDGRACSCGSFGCLEAHASGDAACAYAQERSGKEWDFNALAAGAASHDVTCVEAIKTCAFYLSVALGNMVSMLSPQSIFLGGEFMEACPLLFQKTVEYMERRAYPVGIRNAAKKRFTFQELSSAMGGVALVFDALSSGALPTR